MLFGVITFRTAVDEAIGKVAIQMVPAAIGALLAKSQFGANAPRRRILPPRTNPMAASCYLMAGGSLFLGFNVAPTEEMMLISYQMTEWHALAAVLISVLLMHGFGFAAGFASGSETSPDEPWWSAFVQLTLAGYVIAPTVSLYLLWIFARLDGVGVDAAAMATVVLAFPAATGATAARQVPFL
jgi:putative integral membrane protein (TIGR02587 family)